MADYFKLLAKNLKNVRTIKNLSVEEVSQLCDIPVSYIKKIENNKARGIRISHIFRLVKSLNIDFEELLCNKIE